MVLLGEEALDARAPALDLLRLAPATLPRGSGTGRLPRRHTGDLNTPMDAASLQLTTHLHQLDVGRGGVRLLSRDDAQPWGSNNPRTMQNRNRSNERMSLLTSSHACKGACRGVCRRRCAVRRQSRQCGRRRLKDACKGACRGVCRRRCAVRRQSRQCGRRRLKD
ncbi:uncharacterized protein [Triticum aestivum]|uniref:uncharacterized protein isoform X2 n=1 Tax=Triticum aestivum TaxID=4565 RepID=UPI001D027E33|nr:uncharacterized protein LOC123065578 isoform X2 [Triticum aestivum]